MSTETEGTFEVANASLYTKTWTPEGPVKAKLVHVHGFSDHVNWYNDVYRILASHGIQVFGFDQRGWGRSVKQPSDKGNTGPTSRVIADIAAFIESKLPSDAPVFVLGHSMGGGEVITLAADPQYAKLVSQVRGWLLEAPFIGFAPEEVPSAFKIFAGRLACKILPRFQLKHVLDVANLTRRPEVAKGFKEDPLCHDTGTLEGLASLLDRTGALQSGSVKLGKEVKSLWLGHGDHDKACSYQAAIDFAQKQDIEDKTIKTYVGGYHALHVDLCQEEYAKDITDWILERSQDQNPIEAKL
ncbi:Putative serine hydrolase C5E4.05c [Fusarium oxysporum f. sp. cubense race 1]|uniref:Putative serine hydrolase C5E4.05c n=1 Tax=Fusarium oxysporum f. sp. cubense (strain race 1) TaxID=1229664 RepID=N4U2L9_FUSC1|nr:Putative serine hydrolase C5E4.05c [Fusarium oxysporum f. sp. cubense race 1]